MPAVAAAARLIRADVRFNDVDRPCRMAVCRLSAREFAAIVASGVSVGPDLEQVCREALRHWDEAGRAFGPLDLAKLPNGSEVATSVHLGTCRVEDVIRYAAAALR